MVDSPHGKGVTFTIRSRPMGYAAEYLTRGSFAAIPMGRFPLMFIYCILYHFWGVRRILLPPPRQFRRAPSNHLSSFHSQLKPSIVQTFSSPSFLSQFFQSMFLDPTSLYFLHSPAITPHFAALHSLSSAQSPNPTPTLPLRTIVREVAGDVVANYSKGLHISVLFILTIIPRPAITDLSFTQCNCCGERPLGPSDYPLASLGPPCVRRLPHIEPACGAVA